MRISKAMVVICLSLAPLFASAAEGRYAWITKSFAESYCAEINSNGSEIGKVTYDHCSTKGLNYQWRYVVEGFACSLTSQTNKYFYVMVDNKNCGVPANSYYRWQRRGLGDNFECVLRVKGNDIFYVYVDPGLCAQSTIR